MKKRIDLDAVRTARRNLERIAAEHSELIGESSVEEWTEALGEIEEEDMGKTIQVGVRFPFDVVEAIDLFADAETQKLRVDLPGMELSRTDAIRVLTVAALQTRGYLPAPGHSQDSGVTPRKKKRGTGRTK